VKFLDLEPIARVAGTVKMPGSKSISNRVLLLAALAEGKTRVENLLDSDDTGVMLNALELLGVRIERDPATVRGVHVCGLGMALTPALLRDLEDFARSLLAGTGGGLGWS